jgi:hypothetical protein
MHINEIITENMSYTANEVAKKAKQQNIKPGTDEWFELWFSLPYMIDKGKNTK